MKSTVVVLLALVAACSAASVDARPKRSVVLASAPVVAAPVVAASVPLVRSAVVHANPTTVVS